MNGIDQIAKHLLLNNGTILLEYFVLSVSIENNGQGKIITLRFIVLQQYIISRLPRITRNTNRNNCSLVVTRK